MGIKSGLKKIGEWVEDISKATSGAIKGTVEKGALRDFLDDFASLGGPIGFVFKVASRQIPEPTAEQTIVSEVSTKFFNQLQKELRAHNELCTEATFKGIIKDVKKANELLEREFSWLSLYGRSGQRTSRSWPLVNELADITEAWFTAAAKNDQRYTLENKRTIDAIRGDMADALADTVAKVLQKPEVQNEFKVALDGLGRKTLELLAEDISTLHRLRLFNEVPQDALFIPPRLRYLDCAKTIPDGEIDWKKIEVSKAYDTITTRIAENDSQFVVLFGDMGAGKSCLMRVLASQAAQQYLVDKKRPVVFVRWREIYEKSNLLEAIAEHIQTAHGLPTEDFARQEKMTFFIDGFDEMSSHQNEVVWRLFLKLAELVKRGHSVVVAMRSSILTGNIQAEWRSHKAYVVQVLPFAKEEVNGWAVRWQMRTADVEVTGDRLRSLADESVTTNPLLLFMLARYIHPLAKDGEKMTRAEVFRTFVDETISGKQKRSGEEFPIAPEAKYGYRLLLQEMAYLASWPKSNGKCAEADLATVLTAENREKLQIKEPRTAFVLHFFNPGNVQSGEFEFQPEGFRHYLLAEWCVRALLEVHQDPMDAKTLPLRRKSEAAMQALAQFPLREVERELLNDIATELGTLVRESADTKLVERLQSFGFNLTAKKAKDLIERLCRGLWRHAVTPPAHAWKAENVGVPEGQEIPECLDGVRLLVNYWDQTLLACFGLARGMSNETPVPSPEEKTVEVGRFFHLCSSLRGTSPGTGLNLSRMPLSNVDLSQTQGIETDFTHADLTRAKLYDCNFSHANFSFANLQYANLCDSNLKGTMFCGANLTGVLTGFTNLTDADLAGADLTGANLTDANLTDADLTGADLTGADLAYADLTRANLHNAKVDRVRWKGAILPIGFTPPE